MNTFKTILQEHDLKSTPTRLAVLSYLSEQTKPVDAEAIFVHIDNEHEHADKVTIYRILDALSEKGIVSRLEFGEGKYRYEVAGTDHHHLICENCGKIEDISDCNISELEKDIQTKKQFLVKRHVLEFYGLCSSCQR